MLIKLKSLSHEHEDGFTLIELLVVILIIGILSAIAIPVFLNQRKAANDAAVESDIKNAVTSMETWIAGQQGRNVIMSPSIGAQLSESITTSEGVTLAIRGSSNGYCIIGVHSNGKKYTGTIDTTKEAPLTSLTYDSYRGGMGTGIYPNTPALVGYCVGEGLVIIN